MKIKINKYDGGGLVSFTPIINSAQQQSQVAPSTQSESKPLLDEETYKELIKEGGLVNDVNYFVDQLDNLQSDPLAFLNPNNSNKALKLIAKVNELKVNKELWNKAAKVADEKGGLSEVAVGTYGELYVKDQSGKISQISMNDFKKHSDKYNPLTVSELLNARQYDPQLVYDKSIFEVAENSYGLNKITDHIKTIINDLGLQTSVSETYRDTKELSREYSAANGVKNPTASQLQGLQEIAQLGSTIGDGPEGLYKFKQTLSTERGNLKEALNYIWTTLPQNAQNKLKAVAVLNGGDPSDVSSIITNALIIGTAHEVKTEGDYQKDLSSDSGISSGSESLGKKSDIELMLSGTLDMGKNFQWNDGEGKTMFLPTTWTGPIVSDKKPIGKVTLNQFNSTTTAKYLDVSKATIGGKKIKPWDADKIVSDGETGARAYLPTNPDGTPNFTLLKQFQEAESIVKEHPEWDDRTVNDFYKERGLGFIQVDEKKQILPNVWMKPYLVFYGYTTDQAESIADNKNVEKLTSSEENNVDSMLKPIFKAAGVSVPTGWTGTYGTDYYKGIVAYPILDDASARAAADEGNLYSPKTSVIDVKENIAMSNAKSYPQGTSQLLNLK